MKEYKGTCEEFDKLLKDRNVSNTTASEIVVKFNEMSCEEMRKWMRLHEKELK